jgi:hypothetical protein
MSFGLLFWILMILWLVFGLWTNWPAAVQGQYGPFGGNLLLFILLLLLGWAVFGAAFHP